MKRNSGLADSPFFSPINPIAAAPADESPNPIQPTEANSLVTHSISKNESIVVKQPDDHPIFARKPEIGQAILPESPKSGNMANAVQMALKSKAAKKESFRFPLELMSEIEDIPYQIKKDHKKRVTKTAIFVAALASYIWDFERNGEESLLYKQLIENSNSD